MKAVILASGSGIRMRPLTNEIPKPLISLNGDTILDHEVINLGKAGINNILVTTGPFEEMVMERMKKRHPGKAFEYVNNPIYAETNAIYSLWLAREKINDDVLLLHGDMIFDAGLLDRLIGKTGSCVLVNDFIEPPEKDFKGFVENGIVKKIGVDVGGKGTFFLAPIYKITKEDFSIWMEEIDRRVRANDVMIYAEDAFNSVSGRFDLRAVFYQKELCMEIDTLEDLEVAMKKLGN